MGSQVIIFISALLFYLSDAGTFTWLHADDTVNFVEGETAKLNWSVRIGAGKTWSAVKITRNINTGPGGVDLIRRKPSGVEILLAERGADMDLDVEGNTNVLNVTFTLGNLSRKTDEMYYKITVFDDDPDSSYKYTKLNVAVPSSCTVQPNSTTVNETDIISLSVNTSGNPPVNNYIWTHPNGSSPPGITDRWTFPASRHDTGTYKLSVYNGIGDRGYCTSNITVQFPPSCKLHSNATTVNETDIIWLYVNTTGNPPVNNYIWTHPDGSSPPGITDRWTFPASRHDTGTYKVSVSNGVFGWSYCTRNISVRYKPYDTKISHSPNKTTICLASVINITCTSNANPPVGKYFLYQNENLTQQNSNGRFTVLLNKPGINNFTCIPENMIGVGGKQSLVPIDVKEPPGVGDCKIISSTIIDGSVIEREKVTLMCNNITGSEPLTITWSNRGHNLPNQNKATLTFDPVNRVNDGYYQMTVSNGNECKEAKGKNLTLSVYYFDERICKGNVETITEEGKENDTGIITGLANPVPNLTCWFLKDQNKSVVSWNLTNSQYAIIIDKNSRRNVSCRFSNEVGNCFRNFTILARNPNNVTAKILLLGYNITSFQDDKIKANVSSTIEREFLEVYVRYEKKYVKRILVIKYIKGSVWVNFLLELMANVPYPLLPLQDALAQNNGTIGGLTFSASSLDPGYYAPATSPTESTTTQPTTKKVTPPTDDTLIIIIIVIIVVIVLIGLFVVIWCCCRKKRAQRKNSGLVDKNNAVEIPMDDEAGANDNPGYSPSQYADRGPPHIDPAYDSVDGVKKDAKDRNDNQAKTDKETEESAYATVDKTKKKKKPGELLYADLGDFKKNGDKKAGGRGGILLEPLPKGKDTKMPEKYQETIYAEIVGTKKATSEDAVAASSDGPLAEEHGQDAEAGKEAQKAEAKPTGKTSDPSKTDQNTTTGENDNPPDSHPAKPPSKEESAESFTTMNDRDNTTLTTVSL